MGTVPGMPPRKPAPPVTLSRPHVEPGGKITAIVGVTGVVDEVEDIIQPGAFVKSLRRRRPKGVKAHDWKLDVARVPYAEEWMPGDPRLPKLGPDGKAWPREAGALVMTFEYNLDVQRAADEYKMVKFYAETGEACFSIGYKVAQGKASKRSDGVRVIYEMELFEGSSVLFGAHPLTMALAVKGADGDGFERKYTTGWWGEKAAEPMAGNGTMIALYPPPDVAAQLAVPDGSPADDLHVTLAFLPDNQQTAADLADAVRPAATTTAPLSGQVGGIGKFPPGDTGTPVFVPVDVPGVNALYQAVTSALRDAGIDYAQNHGFTPHLTLGYDLDVTDPVPPTPVQFTDLWVVVGDDKQQIPLGQQADDATATPAPAPVESKAARMVVAAALALEGKGLPKTQKCAHCDAQATKRVLHAEGMAYVPTCDKHLGKTKAEIGASDVSGVRDIPPVEGKAGAGNRGNITPVLNWYTEGEGAAEIAWGTPGDYDRCVTVAAKHMTTEQAKGFCFTGDTEFITRDGMMTFADAVDTTQMVLTAAPPVTENAAPARGDGRWVEAPVRSYGEQRVLRVTVTRNKVRKTIRATPEHVWYASADGKSRARLAAREVQTSGLRPGMTLASLLPMPTTLRTKPSPFGVAAGFIFGDGHNEGSPGCRVDLWGEKDAALLPYFAGCQQSPIKNENGTLGVRVAGIPSSWKKAPTLDEGHPYLLGWLAGYVAADGTVNESGGVLLYSAVRENLEFAQTVATRLGIATYGIVEYERPDFQGRAARMYRLAFVAATVPPPMLVIPEHRRRFDAVEQGRGRAKQMPVRWKVEAVEDLGEREEVFCVEVPDTHTFALADNVWVHNCNLRHHDATGMYPATHAKLDRAGKSAAGMSAKAVVAAARQMETKSMPYMIGSMEYLQDQLRDAARDLLYPAAERDSDDPTPWVCLTATYPDHIVVDASSPGGENESYSIPYTVDPTGAVTLGAPQAVDVVAVVVPEQDAAEDAAAAGEEATEKARYVDPTVAALKEATARVALAPLGGKALEDGVRAALLGLLDELAVKGADVTGMVMGDDNTDDDDLDRMRRRDDTDPLAGDDPDQDQDLTPGKKGLKPKAPAGSTEDDPEDMVDGGDDEATEDDATSDDGTDDPTIAPDIQADAEASDPEDQADGGSDEDTEDESDDGTVKLDPEELHKTLASLRP